MEIEKLNTHENTIDVKSYLEHYLHRDSKTMSQTLEEELSPEDQLELAKLRDQITYNEFVEFCKQVHPKMDALFGELEDFCQSNSNAKYVLGEFVDELQEITLQLGEIAGV